MSHDSDYIYADNAATTALSPAALTAMEPFLTSNFGNPSGIHRVSRAAAESLKELRARMAGLLGAASPREIYFTSGGSESDNWVLRGAAQRTRDLYGGAVTPRIVTSAIEHHAVLHCCDALRSAGCDVDLLPVDEQGRVCARALEDALTANEALHEKLGIGADRAATSLVSIMLANNEVGTMQGVKALAKIAHAHNVPFHSDAVQAVGHVPVNVQELGVDALSLSAHKFHGPRGVGALYLKEGFSIPPLIAGGAQERGERAGTENLAGIAGMVAALEESLQNQAEKQKRIAGMRDELVQAVLSQAEDVRYTGDPARRLPSIASFVCKDVDGELLVVLLDKAGIAAATGSACSTGSTDPSHVVTALGIDDPRWAKGSLRLSLGDDLTSKQLERLKDLVPKTIQRARSLSGML